MRRTVRLVDNLHVRELAPLTTPWVVKHHLPLTEATDADLDVPEPLPEGEYRVYDPEGDFLCLSRLEGGVLTSIKNFFGA